MTRVAVTGASGFIGRYVARELERRGIAATLVRRQADAIEDRSGRVVSVDVAAPPADLFERLGYPDTIIHLAWGGLPNYRSLHHFETELPNHYGFLKALITAGVKHCLVTGTCFEYGNQSGALHERLETRPTNPYGLGKDMLRRQLECLRGEVPFALTWARLFYVYGDGQAPGSLWSQITACVKAGRREFPMSGGEQLRDYLPVATAASHLVTLAVATRDAGVINVCSGVPVSVRGLVERWIAEHGWAVTPVLGAFPYADYEPMAFWGDAAKLRRVLADAGAGESIA